MYASSLIIQILESPVGTLVVTVAILVAATVTMSMTITMTMMSHGHGRHMGVGRLMHSTTIAAITVDHGRAT